MGEKNAYPTSVRHEIAEQVYGYILARGREGVSSGENMIILYNNKEFSYRFKVLLRKIEQYSIILNGQWIHLYYNQDGKPDNLVITGLPIGNISERVHELMILIIKGTLAVRMHDPTGATKTYYPSSSGCFSLEERNPEGSENGSKSGTPIGRAVTEMWKKMRSSENVKPGGDGHPLHLEQVLSVENIEDDLR